MAGDLPLHHAATATALRRVHRRAMKRPRIARPLGGWRAPTRTQLAQV